MPYADKMYGNWRLHRWNATQRGIPFLLSFEEWREIWLASGKWLERGTRKGRYCMARYGDQGAYEIGNVRICLAEENRAERNAVYPLDGDKNPAFGKDYWATANPDVRERWHVRLGHKASVRAKVRPRSSDGRFL